MQQVNALRHFSTDNSRSEGSMYRKSFTPMFLFCFDAQETKILELCHSNQLECMYVFLVERARNYHINRFGGLDSNKKNLRKSEFSL